MSNGNIDSELISLLDDVDKDLSESLGDKQPPPEEDKASQKYDKIPINSVYLKKVVEGEKQDLADKLVFQLDKAMTAPIKDDKTLFRQRLISTYWNFIGSLILRINHLNAEKLNCLRYGILDMNLLMANQVSLIKNIPFNTSAAEYTFYY